MKQSAILIMLAMLIACVSCEEHIAKPSVAYTVTLSYPDDFASSSAVKPEGITVKLIAQSGASLTTKTDANGVAHFNIEPDIYKVEVQSTLSADEALEITGEYKAVMLTYVKNSMLITENQAVNAMLEATPYSNIIIGQYYFSGTTATNGSTQYIRDMYVELYNNSPEMVYMDSLYLGFVYGSNSPTEFKNDQDNVYIDNLLMISGSGTDFPIQPYQSILVAIDGYNHNETTPYSVDLSKADMEFYMDPALYPKSNDTDYPDVPNSLLWYYSASYNLNTITQFMVWTAGQSMVIFKGVDWEKLEKAYRPGIANSKLFLKVPKKILLDGVDCVNKNTADAANLKRIPTSVDAGWAPYPFAAKCGYGIVRKVERIENGNVILQNTNNSAADFEARPVDTRVAGHMVPRKYDYN